jgi:hypothetical protein
MRVESGMVSCVQTVWLLRLGCGFGTASDFVGGVGEGQAVWLGHCVCDVGLLCIRRRTKKEVGVS